MVGFSALIENLPLNSSSIRSAICLRWPGINVVRGDAYRLRHTLAGVVPGSLAAIVSGLPLLSMRAETQRTILSGAFEVLREGGSFTQFTYGPRPPLAPALQADLGLMVEKGQRVWVNLPPARVYRFVRARSAACSGPAHRSAGSKDGTAVSSVARIATPQRLDPRTHFDRAQ